MGVCLIVGGGIEVVTEECRYKDASGELNVCLR